MAFVIRLISITFTQREVENLPLNGIGLVDLTFDEPLVLDRYQQNPLPVG